LTTGLCTDPRFHEHRPPWEHPERPERLEAIERALADAGVSARTVQVEPRPATRAELERVHSPAHLDELERTLANGQQGWLDADTYYSPRSWEAALLAAGATVELATRVADGRLSNGGAFVRPPGHHATRDRAMGFCLLNNVAVAAAALEAAGKRVAVIDWDVHHGNGTEAIFDEDPGVLYVSTHEWPQYPGTGPAHHTGRGKGTGTKVNVPLPRGTDPERYLDAWNRWVQPAVESYNPDVILVSAGFDAHDADPIGGLRLVESTYDQVLRKLLAVQPRLAVVLEGGYDLGAIARSSVRVMKTLLGDPPDA
jgi:acetoin utilization deacetylase AcuC-like enzyme